MATPAELFHRSQRARRLPGKHSAPGKRKRLKRQRDDWIRSDICIEHASFTLTLIITTRFCTEVVKVPLPDGPNPYEGGPPSLNQIEAFLLWNAQRKNGLLDNKITVKTLKNDWDYLRRDIEAHTGHKYAPAELGEIDLVSQVVDHTCSASS
jgi:hypothetical protein